MKVTMVMYTLVSVAMAMPKGLDVLSARQDSSSACSAESYNQNVCQDKEKTVTLFYY